MTIAKIFMTGRSQAVRLPAAYRFDQEEVFIRRNENGDVVLSARPEDWSSFIAAANATQDETLILDRDSSQQQRDPFADWSE